MTFTKKVTKIFSQNYSDSLINNNSNSVGEMSTRNIWDHHLKPNFNSVNEKKPLNIAQHLRQFIESVLDYFH